MQKCIFISSILLFTFHCYGQNKTFSQAETINLLKSNLEYLASDAMQGREATTEYENKAAEFIASQMNNYGLSPFYSDGFIQNIPVTVTKINRASKVTLYDSEGVVQEFQVGDNWVTEPKLFDLSMTGKVAELYFCGYGITADEYDYDDYKDVDVEGKIVVALFGEPSSDDPDYFAGAKPTKYYSAETKLELAKAKGAIGIVLIPDESFSAFWIFLKRMVMINKVELMEDQKEQKIYLPGALLSPELSKKLLTGEEFSLEEIMRMQSGNNLKPFPLKKQMKINLGAKSWEDQLENVVTFIEGSDPELKKEFITIGAHYDHDGTWDGEVFNGADDNGSGTVAVMEAMRRLKDYKPKRSVLGILFSGEEKGLLGSKYFVRKFLNTENIVANINIDMCGRENPDSLVSKGSQETSSELYALVQQVDEEMDDIGLSYEPGINAANGTSDHASFANAGIPAVYFGDKMKDDLHRPSDDVDKIDFTKIEKTVHLIENLVKKIDTLDHQLSRENE